MYIPEYHPQEPVPGIIIVDKDGKPEKRVEATFSCLLLCDVVSYWNDDLASSLRYWKIRDYAHAYRSRIVTPSMVAEHIFFAIEDFNVKKTLMSLFIYCDAKETRKQAVASTKRFEKGIATLYLMIYSGLQIHHGRAMVELIISINHPTCFMDVDYVGNPTSILDDLFIAIKDDIDLYLHPFKGGTTWMHEVCNVEKDVVCVSRLRSCGMIFVRKANMHELGIGTT